LICLVVDRVHAGMLGAYGNSWIRTGQFDRLASDSFLFDQAVIDCPQLEQVYRGYWFGSRAAAPRAGVASFAQALATSGMHAALLTDEPDVARFAGAADFAERVIIESPPDAQSAEDVADTQLARLFGSLTAWLESPPRPFCLWVHARGLGAAWDAPLEMRDQYAEDEDPEPPRFTAVPNRRLADPIDPDELLGITHAYAGQISLLDACLGAFYDLFLQSQWAATTQLTFTSSRGFPLGEHHRIGRCDEALYNETVQVPWLMRFPDGFGKLARSQALVQPADLPGTLLDWLDVDRAALSWSHASSLLGIAGGDDEALRDCVLLNSQQDRAIRTPAWLLRQPTGGAAELYAKPGDRWEVNEVAKLFPNVVAGLQAALSEMAQPGPAGPSSPLAEALVTQFD
jgi:hypothetical protein